MAFADPQSFKLGADTIACDRVFVTAGVGTFESSNDQLVMNIRPSKAANGRVRQVVAIDRAGVAEDPILGVKSSVNQRVTLILDSPSYGFTDAESAALIEGLKTWLSAANITKFVAGEN